MFEILADRTSPSPDAQPKTLAAGHRLKPLLADAWTRRSASASGRPRRATSVGGDCPGADRGPRV